MVKKVSHSGNLVTFLSLGRDSSQNLVILVKLEPSGYFLNIQNPARAQNVTPRDVLVAKRQSEVRRTHLKLPMGASSGTNFEFSVESKLMTPAGNFLNHGICLVCTQENLPGPFGWKMKAFGLWLPYSGSTGNLCFQFSDCFSGFWPKCVSEHSQTQFKQAYWVENCTARLISHTSWTNDLPKLINTSSNKLETF